MKMSNIKREEVKKEDIREIAQTFCQLLGKKINYIIYSDYVLAVHDKERKVESLKILIEKVSEDLFKKVHEELIRAGFDCLESEKADILYKNYLNTGAIINYVLVGQPETKIQLRFPKNSFQENEIKNRVKLPLANQGLYFATMESILAFKEQLPESPQDSEDAIYLRDLYEGRVNEEEINKIKQSIKEKR